MTSRHFRRAAEIIRNIDTGNWCFTAEQLQPGTITEYREAAYLVAEAFVTLFRAYNDRFDEQRFLAACFPEDK